MWESLQNFFVSLLELVIVELVAVFGLFFLFGFILYFIEKRINSSYTSAFGWKGLYFTAWLGTPIHEVGHIFFAKIFRHKIVNVELFKPNKSTGGLGHVEHSYNPTSIYQQIGHFFIGSAPLTFGIIVLTGLLFALMPGARDGFINLANSEPGPLFLASSILEFGYSFIKSIDLSSLSFWFFIYLSFCITSHMSPSKYDQKNMYKGLFWLFAVLLVLNIVPLLLQFDVVALIQKTYQFTGIILAMLIYSVIISLLHLLTVIIVLDLPKKLLNGIKKV